jgi:hypothetical protein
VIGKDRLTISFWNLLSDALMRSSLIEVLDIATKDTMQLLLLEDKQVIETLSPHTAQKAFTDSVSPWCVRRCFQDLDAAGGCHAREIGSKLAVTIPNEILRPLSKRSRFPQRYVRSRHR